MDDRPIKELLPAGFFCLAFALVPVFRIEFFPFSRAPMFAEAPQKYCRYQVWSPEEKALPLQDFGLQENYWGNPLGEGAGFLPPPSLCQFGEVADKNQVTRWVEMQLQRFDLPSVGIVQEVIGPVEGGGIGVIRKQRWTVHSRRSKGFREF
jgi:hypothetical protein